MRRTLHRDKERSGRLHTKSPPATRFVAANRFSFRFSVPSLPALSGGASGLGGSGASGGSGGKEGRCESSMICRTRSTRRSVDSRFANPPSSDADSSAFDRSPPRTRSNGSNTLRPSRTTTPAFADARVVSWLGRTTPADDRVSCLAVDALGAPRDPPRELQTSSARIAMARGPSAAFGTRVPPRVGLLLRRGARKSPRDADAGGPTPIARVATRVVLL